MCVVLFFFFKQKTAYEMRISDWSSDVCSSDLYLWSLALTSWSAWRVVPLQEATNPMVNGQPARPNGDQRARYRRPGQVKIRPDRKSVVSGKSVSVRVDLGGRRIIKKKIYTSEITQNQTHQLHH